jgi:hypothetical protein
MLKVPTFTSGSCLFDPQKDGRPIEHTYLAGGVIDRSLRGINTPPGLQGPGPRLSFADRGDPSSGADRRPLLETAQTRAMLSNYPAPRLDLRG